MLITAALLTALAVARPLQDPAPPEAAAEPVCGVWKGLARGKGELLPVSGVPATLLLSRGEPDGVTGSLTVQGFDGQTASGTFDAATGALELKGAFGLMPFRVQATVGGEQLKGKLSSIGMSFELEATRISLSILDEPEAPSSPADPAGLGPEDWAEDLRFLAAYLPQVHANAYHQRPVEESRRAATELEARLSELDGRRTAIALAQLVAGVGDAHTELFWRELPGFDLCPLRLTSFADGLFVTEVDERWADALGTRVLRIGSVPTAEALAAVATVFASENDSWQRAKAPGLVVIPALLHLLGVNDSPEALPLVVEVAPGESLELTITLKGDGPRLRTPDPNYDPVPTWRTRTGENYWFEPLAGEPVVYLAYNRCAEDPARPMAGFVDEVLAAVEEHSAERLVIDLRHNSGGNSAILGNHVEGLAAHPRLARPGGVVALIGPVTYSSGMLNAHQLSQAGATLLGEPTGGKPNSYGELRSFRLPRSGLKVFYSTKYFRMLEEDPLAVEPDVLVELSSFEHFSGEDPVLERALELEK